MLADNMDRWADPVEELLLHSLKGESKFEIRTVSVQWTQRVGPPPHPKGQIRSNANPSLPTQGKLVLGLICPKA